MGSLFAGYHYVNTVGCLFVCLHKKLIYYNLFCVHRFELVYTVFATSVVVNVKVLICNQGVLVFYSCSAFPYTLPIIFFNCKVRWWDSVIRYSFINRQQYNDIAIETMVIISPLILQKRGYFNIYFIENHNRQRSKVLFFLNTVQVFKCRQFSILETVRRSIYISRCQICKTLFVLEARKAAAYPLRWNIAQWNLNALI